MTKKSKSTLETATRMADEDQRDFREVKRAELDRFIKADNEWMKDQPDRERGLEVVRMEFRRFLHAIVLRGRPYLSIRASIAAWHI